ncbi:hypothetical protein QUA43_08115 [Microcoleus sp. N9_B4]
MLLLANKPIVLCVRADPKLQNTLLNPYTQNSVVLSGLTDQYLPTFLKCSDG